MWIEHGYEWFVVCRNFKFKSKDVQELLTSLLDCYSFAFKLRVSVSVAVSFGLVLCTCL